MTMLKSDDSVINEVKEEILRKKIIEIRSLGGLPGFGILKELFKVKLSMWERKLQKLDEDVMQGTSWKRKS